MKTVVCATEIHRYKIFGKTILKVIKTQYYTRWVLLHVLKFDLYKCKRFSAKQFVRALDAAKYPMLFFNHMLGGGTALYANQKIHDLSVKHDVISVYMDNDLNKYIFVLNNRCFITKNLYKINYTKLHSIVVNNLAGYTRPDNVLGFITDIKAKKTDINVDFMVHDFMCICPGVHLLRPDFKSCVHKNVVKCTKCMQNQDISKWREKWHYFLKNVADNIIVFSHSSKEILLSIYPDIEYKIQIIPHNTPRIRNVKIKPHDTINIGIIGNLTSVKGKELVCDMIKQLPQYVNIIHIGKYFGDIPNNPKFIYTGPYDLDQLPNLIEYYKIDIVFISSVVPETFSFTTSESMSMGIPVACFNIGAQVERVSKYKYGLVISKINATIALNEILDFVNSIKGGRK